MSCTLPIQHPRNAAAISLPASATPGPTSWTSSPPTVPVHCTTSLHSHLSLTPPNSSSPPPTPTALVMSLSSMFHLPLLLLLLLSISAVHGAPDVVWTLNADHTSTIRVNGAVWFHSGATWFHALNQTFSSADSSLALTNTRQHLGSDALGQFNATSLTWQTKSTPPLSFLTTYRLYPHPSTPTTRCIVFEQLWTTGAQGTSVGNSDAVLSSFPSFRPRNASATLGALEWGDGFADNKVFVLSGPGATLPLYRGGTSGPLVVFDQAGRVSATLSPFNSFMASSVVASSDGSTVEFGVVGSMQSIPAGYSVETIAMFSDEGVTEGVMAWGDALLGRYGKRREAYLDEFLVQYLGYSTDGGGYYYYNTELGFNYEKTLQDVNTDALARHIPYRHMFLDSWWYYKGELGGVKNWTARPDVFPSGLQALHANLTYPFLAHNRWWAPETDYSTTNGGAYEFVFGNSYGLPVVQAFWDDLMRNSSVWGLKMYQQDWLLSVWDALPQIKEDVHLGRQWLIQMGQGGAKVGINVQYCMPYPRHLLQSVEIPNVLQARASGDNDPPNQYNWVIGESSLLLYAIGVAPYKDVFWTSSVEPNNTYNNGTGNEPAPELHAVIATLSTGSVYPGDAIGFTDIPLLARSHRADGFILKPDRPAFSLDSSYVYRAFGQGPDAKQITHTYTTLAGRTYHIFLVAQAARDYNLTFADLRLSEAERYSVYSYHNRTLSLPQLTPFDATTPLRLAATPARESFTLYYTAPRLSNGLVMLGEVSKWVPVSRGRVAWLQEDEAEVRLGLIGGAGELVTWWWATPAGSTRSVDITLNGEGRATLTIPVAAAPAPPATPAQHRHHSTAKGMTREQQGV